MKPSMDTSSGDSFVRKVDGRFDGWRLLHHWPPAAPLLYLGGSGRYAVFVLSFSEVPAAAAYAKTFRTAKAAAPVPFQYGILGILSYDDFAPPTPNNPGNRRCPSRFLQVYATLTVDQKTGEAWHCGFTGVSAATSSLADLDRWLAAGRMSVANSDAAPAFHLDGDHDDATYKNTIENILRDIGAGRYYQINFLRYFRVHEQAAMRRHLARRMQAFAGPYAAWVELPGLSLVSFSPERFFAVSGDGNGEVQLDTFPIKGTAAREKLPEQDAARRAALFASSKDRAELNMIIDLMRNDLHRVCQPRSVKVLDAGKLQTFANVHHLAGHVQGLLRPATNLGELCAALCPAGSITGAPKIEVMAAIAAYEQRPRGYLMGNIFFYDEATGHLDASVLIRTMQKLGDENSYEFAAGSGIVVKSNAADELNEINSKCRVLNG